MVFSQYFADLAPLTTAFLRRDQTRLKYIRYARGLFILSEIDPLDVIKLNFEGGGAILALNVPVLQVHPVLPFYVRNLLPLFLLVLREVKSQRLTRI